MNYNINTLAQMYQQYLSQHDFDVHAPISHTCDLATYNEYEYISMMQHFDVLYYHIDSVAITERFLKGD